MAFADFTDKVILEAWGLTRITLTAACKVGDLLNRDGALADADANKPANYVAIEKGAAGATIWAARFALVGKQTTIGAGGAATAGTHGGTTDDVLWLSATAGRPSATPVANIGQVVGVCVSTEKFTLEPKEEYFPLAELVAANKTLDEQDTGKQMVVTADAVVVTLPAVAAGLHFTVVNGMNDGGALVSVSPAAVDEIQGPDYAGVDNKDWQNTKITARCGDLIEIQGGSAAGWTVTKLVGTWAQEA